MNISLPPINWLSVLPCLVLTATGILVLFWDLWMQEEERPLLAWLGLIGLLITGVVSFARPCFWSGRLSEQHLIDRRRTAGEPRCRAASAELAAHQVEFVAAAWPRARRFDRPSVLALVGVVTIAVDCSRPRNLAAPGPARSARRHDRHSVEHTRFG